MPPSATNAGDGISRMHEIFIARQPIFDRELNLFAYELLFRHADAAAAAVIDGDRATSEVILNAFTVIGLDELVGNNKAFLNFTRSFLINKHRLPFPRDRVVLEMLEGSVPDRELLAAVAELKEQGYQVALDDFVFSEALLPLVELADIIKIEISVLTPPQVREHVEILRRYPAKLLAEKVETQEEFELCRELGFDYFQGFFLSRPRTLRRSALPTHRLPTLRLLAALHDPGVSIADLERIVTDDVGLSYKLLRYLNSAFFQVRHRVDSVHQAIMYLGLDELRAWASLLALTAVEGKPEELMAGLTVRARMCENLAVRLNVPGKATCFSVGLFSGLDALLDTPLEDILSSLNLSDEVCAAVLRHEGEAGRLLDCALSYERGDWDRIGELRVPHETAIQAYLDAIQWTDELRRTW